MPTCSCLLLALAASAAHVAGGRCASQWRSNIIFGSHLCRAAVAFSSANADTLRLGGASLLRDATQALQKELEAAASSSDRHAQAKRGMCVETLVQHVYLPHADVQSASDVLTHHRAALNADLVKVCTSSSLRNLCKRCQIAK